jgi:hypothetical protein
MSSIPRPVPAYHATTLSLLVDAPAVEKPHSTSYTHHLPRRQTAPARPSGWNRQSVLLFADFNKFESSRGSRAQRRAGSEDDSDYGSPPNLPADERHLSSTSISSFKKNLPEPPYHVFSLAKKKQMVYIVSLAGLFSPLSSNTYFPALGQISKVRILFVSLHHSLTGHRTSTLACH